MPHVPDQVIVHVHSLSLCRKTDIISDTEGGVLISGSTTNAPVLRKIQHNTGIADGLSGLGEALAALADQGIAMIYDETHMILAQGNFVLAVSEGTFGGAPTSYYDLWRVENGKIAEHWDVMETIADQSTWANENGKF